MSEKPVKNYAFYLHQTKLIRRGFSEVPNIGFKLAKNFKDHLIETVLPQLHRKGKYKSCEGGGGSIM